NSRRIGAIFMKFGRAPATIANRFMWFSQTQKCVGIKKRKMDDLALPNECYSREPSVVNLTSVGVLQLPSGTRDPPAMLGAAWQFGIIHLTRPSCQSHMV